MRFYKRFERNKVPAWAPFYVSYQMLRDFLSPFKHMKKGIHCKTTPFTLTVTDLHLCDPYGQGTLDVINFTANDKKRLLHFIKLFEEQLVNDMDKVYWIFY